MTSSGQRRCGLRARARVALSEPQIRAHEAITQLDMLLALQGCLTRVCRIAEERDPARTDAALKSPRPVLRAAGLGFFIDVPE